MAVQKAGNDFDLIGIGGVFSSPLQVPKHQREYAWQKQEVKQLLDDLTEAMTGPQDYFLGTIVTVKNSETGRLDVIDGQQRLTTVTMIYRALIDKLEEKSANSQVTNKLLQDRLTDFNIDTEENSPRLILNIDDDEFFRQLLSLTGGPATTHKPSHKRLKEGLKICREWISSLVDGKNDNNAIAELKNLDNFLLSNTSVLLLKTSDPSQAFKMFETLNDRGLRTSQADLVKSYLFGRSATRVDEAQAKWSSMKDNLSELDDDNAVVTFLRHVLIATKAYVKAQDVFDFTQKHNRGQSSALALLNNLEELSSDYVATYKPITSKWVKRPEKAKRALEVLNLFDIQPIRPLILSLSIRFNDKELSDTLAFLVSLTVRNVIAARSRSQQFESTFASCAKSVYDRKIDTAKEVKDLLKAFIVNDEDFKSFFSKANSSKASLSRYYLRALEEGHNSNEHPWFLINKDTEIVNLEHILPKTHHGENWHKFDEDEHKFYRNKIGNLCLMDSSRNSGSGQDGFSDKKVEYAKSKFILTNSINQLPDWTKESIDQRQSELAEIARKVWAI